MKLLQDPMINPDAMDSIHHNAHLILKCLDNSRTSAMMKWATLKTAQAYADEIKHLTTQAIHFANFSSTT